MQRSWLVRYGVAVVAAFAAAVATRGQPELRDHSMFLLPFGAVTASALFGGFGPTLLSVIVGIGLLGPIALGRPFRMAVFVLLGIVVGFASEKQRAARAERWCTNHRPQGENCRPSAE